MSYTLSIFTENSPGVLHRITVMFTKRKLNIESLTVSETGRDGISRFTIVISGVDEPLIRTIARQIKRIIEVLDVQVCTDEEIVSKEIAFFRVVPADQNQREAIIQLSHEHHAPIIYLDDSSLVLEKSGTEKQISTVLSALEPFHVKEFIRSGRIAILKTAQEFVESLPELQK